MYRFEGKLHAFRRTQDGVVVSYLVHPSDVSTELATAALGTRYMVAVAEIGDDEKPIELVQSGDVVACGPDENTNGKREGLDSAPAKRKFEELAPSQRCALRCQDASFQQYVAHKFAGILLPVQGNPDACAERVRNKLGILSRSQLDTDWNAQRLWDDLESDYQSWLTDARYSGSKR